MCHLPFRFWVTALRMNIYSFIHLKILQFHSFSLQTNITPLCKCAIFHYPSLDNHLDCSHFPIMNVAAMNMDEQISL